MILLYRNLSFLCIIKCSHFKYPNLESLNLDEYDREIIKKHKTRILKDLNTHNLKMKKNDLENEAKLSVIKNLSKYIEEENYTVITEACFIKDENKINSILADYEIDYDFNFDLDDNKEENFFYEDMLIMNYLPIQESMYEFLTAS